MKIVSVLFVVFSSIQISFSQNILTGKVVDQYGETLLGVNVYIENTYDGASTNRNGGFTFKTHEIGERTLLASYIGYKTTKTIVNISANSSLKKIVLDEEINKIDGVTINAGAFEASDKKKSVVLKTFDVVTTAGATADVTGVMNTLPGTQTVGEEGRLFVRGGAGHETKTFINGLLLANPYSLTPQHIPSRFRFSPFLFKGAFFSTGGYSAEYGQALSSVLQLNTYDLPSSSQTDISVMSVGADISQTIRINNTSLYGQVQYNDLASYFALVPQKYEWSRAPNSINTTLHFKQKFINGGHIQAYTNYDKSKLKISQPIPGNIYEFGTYDITNNNLYSNLSFNNPISDRISARGGISFSSNRNLTVSARGGLIGNQTKSIHVKAVFDHDVSENVLVKFGGEWINDDFSEEMILAEDQPSKFLNFNNHMISPFAEADVYFSNNFVARLGVRYEYSQLLSEHSISPRASLAYKVDKSSQFSLAFGKFSQLPITSYLKWSHSIKKEKGEHYILNYQFSSQGRIFRTEIYYKKYDQLTSKSMNQNHIIDFKNDGYGEAKGFELFWRDSKSFESIDYWLSYSFLDTKRKYDIFPYPVMPYYASNHNLSIVYKQFIAKLKSQVGWTYSFASGRPYTDPNTLLFNSERTNCYHDISINYSYLIKPNMILHASVSNVLGFNHVFGYQYNKEPNEQGAYESMTIGPQAKRFFFMGFFITISKDKSANQLNNL